MERIGLHELESSLGDVVNLVNSSKLRVLVEDHGEPCAAFVSVEDFELLKNLDKQERAERHDVEDLRKTIREHIQSASERKRRTVLQRKGIDTVALISTREFDMLEQLDDGLSLEAARRLLEEELGLD